MRKTFFTVLKGNIECAFCKEKNCPLRYEPNHKIQIHGTRLKCKRDSEKRLKKL